MNAHEEGADGQEEHRVTAWITAGHVVASAAQSAVEHGVCLDLLSFVFPPRFPAWRCVPCSVWQRQNRHQSRQMLMGGGRGSFLVCMLKRTLNATTASP